MLDGQILPGETDAFCLRLAAGRRPDFLGVRLHYSNRSLLAGDEHSVALFGGYHRAELQTVIERHQAACEPQDDGERSRDQETGEHSAKIRAGRFEVFVLFTFDGAPERRRDDACRLLKRQALDADEVVHDIGNDFRIGLERALVSVHLQEPAVGVIG